MGVVFFVFLWPLVAVAGLVGILATLASSIVLSPAFPFLLGSLVLNILAAADAVRLIWKWFHDGERFNIKESVKRPLILVIAGFVAFWVGVVLAATVIMSFFNGSAEASAAQVLFQYAAYLH